MRKCGLYHLPGGAGFRWLVSSGSETRGLLCGSWSWRVEPRARDSHSCQWREGQTPSGWFVHFLEPSAGVSLWHPNCPQASVLERGQITSERGSKGGPQGLAQLPQVGILLSTERRQFPHPPLQRQSLWFLVGPWAALLWGLLREGVEGVCHFGETAVQRQTLLPFGGSPAGVRLTGTELPVGSGVGRPLLHLPGSWANWTTWTWDPGLANRVCL